MSFHRWLSPVAGLIIGCAFVACSGSESEGDTNASRGEGAGSIAGGANGSNDGGGTGDTGADTARQGRDEVGGEEARSAANDTGGTNGQGNVGGEAARRPDGAGTADSSGPGASSGDGGAASNNGTSPMVATACGSDDVCEAEQFCRGATDGENGLCVAGCREDGCGAGLVCDTETGVCNRDLRCEDDAGCRPLEYCADAEEGTMGTCEMGCRTPNDMGQIITQTTEDGVVAVLCPPDEEG
ncbi:MAG: hypothetical protein VX589_16325, partial [Myxococcota bacterium]|nr:hypothetical protein [Myxococcota bacterium]